MKKLMKDSMDLTTGSIFNGVGAKAIGDVGGNAAGINALSKSYPTLGHLAGSEAVMKGIKKLK